MPPSGTQTMVALIASVRRCAGVSSAAIVDAARQRAADPEPGEKPERAMLARFSRKSDAARGHAEQQHAADDRGPPAEAVADIARERAAEAHADQSRGDHRREIFPASRPIPG